jgi:hypothetical protein
MLKIVHAEHHVIIKDEKIGIRHKLLDVYRVLQTNAPSWKQDYNKIYI